ncbi:hypothetical protein LIER_42371 [Lithospermum erythrorhizon]|uniref:Integrase catalytic domain-containing protein n=1 Tax=Lithospermum erythrorhizon TaxID=34254 RepID=A0AAV3RNK6_LITER
MFIKFMNEVENQFDRKIKRIRSDRGGEYRYESLIDFCEMNGIIHETSAPYLPQQNGIVERKNQTLKNMINVMLQSSGLSNEMWGKTVLSAYVTFSTEYLIRSLPDPKRTNIGSKTYYCVLIGYAQNNSAYRFISISDRTILEARDAEFFEHIFPLNNGVTIHHIVPGVPDESYDTNRHASCSTSNLQVNEPRKSNRARVEKIFGD